MIGGNMKKVILMLCLLLSGCYKCDNKYHTGETVIYNHNGKDVKAIVNCYNNAGVCWISIRDEWGRIHMVGTTEEFLRNQ